MKHLYIKSFFSFAKERRLVFAETAPAETAPAETAPEVPDNQQTSLEQLDAQVGQQEQATMVAAAAAAAAVRKVLMDASSADPDDPESREVLEGSGQELASAKVKHDAEVTAAVKEFRATLAAIGGVERGAKAGEQPQEAVTRALQNRPQAFLQFLEGNRDAALQFAAENQTAIDALCANEQHPEIIRALNQARTEQKSGSEQEAQAQARVVRDDIQTAIGGLKSELDQKKTEEKAVYLGEFRKKTLTALTDLENPSQNQRELAQALVNAGANIPALNTVLHDQNIDLEEISPDVRLKLGNALDALQNSDIGSNVAAYLGAGEVAAQIRHPDLAGKMSAIELTEEDEALVQAKGGDPEVAKLQKAINDARYPDQPPIAVDGLYGQYTREAEKILTPAEAAAPSEAAPAEAAAPSEAAPAEAAAPSEAAPAEAAAPSEAAPAEAAPAEAAAQKLNDAGLDIKKGDYTGVVSAIRKAANSFGEGNVTAVQLDRSLLSPTLDVVITTNDGEKHRFSIEGKSHASLLGIKGDLHDAGLPKYPSGWSPKPREEEEYKKALKVFLASG